MYNIKKDIPKYLFREYDIRGKYKEEIDEDFAYTFGLSYGSYIKQLGKTSCVVSHDNRTSATPLTEALITGITSSGIDVVDLGLTTTPMFYYACIKLNIPSGVMVTASHNPKDENGFKFSYDERSNARGKMITDLYDFTMKFNFSKGDGKITKYDIKNDYIKLFDDSLDIKDNNLNIVIDTGNGTTSIIAKEIYSKYVNKLTCICEKSDGTFPNHHPDPSVEENLSMLKKKVLELNADIGLAFDGDGDRIGIVDETGKLLQVDHYMIIIIRDIINKVKNKMFLYDVKCSKALEDEILKLGGTPYEYRTGNSYTKAKTKELDLVLGGEYSGHIYFRDRFPGFDSGLYAGLRLIEIMVKTNKKLSELTEGINKYYSTNEIKIKTTEEKKQIIVDKIKEYANDKNYKTNTIDGVKILFDDGFSLIRASNTGPNLILRFESGTEEKLEKLKSEYINLVNELNK